MAYAVFMKLGNGKTNIVFSDDNRKAAENWISDARSDLESVGIITKSAYTIKELTPEQIKRYKSRK